MGWFSRVAAVIVVSMAVGACGSSSSNAGPSPGARLLVRLNVGYGPSPDRHVADYLSDGTVIRVRDEMMETNRLTEGGMAALQAVLAANADLLTTPMQIAPRSTVVPVPNNIPSGIVELVNAFILERSDGTRYTVSAPSRHAGSALAGGDDPVVERLTALGDGLSDPATLLGPGAFTDPEWQPYQPALTAVYLILEELAVDDQVVSDGVIPHVGPTEWPFEGSPQTFGGLYKGPGTHVTRRCAFLPSADVSTAAVALSKLLSQKQARPTPTPHPWRSGSLLWVTSNQATIVNVQALPLFPEDGGLGCADALIY